MKDWTKLRKHFDFILADLLIIQLANLLGTLSWAGLNDTTLYLGLQFWRDTLMLFLTVLVSLAVSSPYKNVLKRDKYEEVIACAKHTFILLVIYLFLVFFSHEGGSVSRLTVIFTWINYFLLEIIFRLVWKKVLRRYFLKEHQLAGSAMILLTNQDYAKELLNGLVQNIYTPYFIKAIFLADFEPGCRSLGGIPVKGNLEDAVQYAANHWVDEVMIGFPDKTQAEQREIEKHFRLMGITIHQVLLRLRENWYSGEAKIEKYGKYLVATQVLRYVPAWKWAAKRLGDILGALIGLFFAGLAYLYIAPKLRKADKGPVIYTSTRIGCNGKPFKFYKFRSMYMDADERKKELLAQNKMQGLMFKMDNDPRIIPGIGEFIRKTSLDEFPQFWNVLKGDMSLVGTRPPTQDEWEHYSEEHRIRLTQRPGITGIWQVSGRSDITDFEEIVKMDEKYIETWTLSMDFAILCKTVMKVFKREGAE